MAVRLQSPSGVAEAIYFRAGGETLFGWWHQPARTSASGLGLVVCNPFGYEAICAHRSIREFAETAAGAGIPSLRFDYLGTGDSADIDDGADQLTRWIEDVGAAVEELKRRTGVQRVCLLGIRLGALLAARAAAQRQDIASLILIGPVVSGRRYIREMRTTQLAGLALSPADESHGEKPAECAAADGLEAGGFVLTQATLDSLSKVDLHGTRPTATQSILILDNDKLPSAKQWVESVAPNEGRLDYRVLPGLIEMAMTAPQFAIVPRAMIAAVRDWLLEIAGAGSQGAAAAEASGPQVLTMADDPRSPHALLTERPVLLPGGVPLFGIVAEPGNRKPCLGGIILLNPGADFHIGANRMYVTLARRWARAGYVVLRLDLAGIGDSATRPDERADEVFPDQALADIRCAIETLRTELQVDHLALGGLCSGAYHALRAAAAGMAVNRILLVNPQNYFWEKGMTLEQLQLAEVVHNPGVYRRRVLSLSAWRKLLSGRVRLGRIAAIYFHRARLEAAAVWRNIARRLKVPISNDLGSELTRIVANGTRVVFVFARGEPGIELLELQAGSALTRLGDRCRVRIINGGDHIFSRRGPRSILEGVLSEEVFERSEREAKSADTRRPNSLNEVSAR